MTREQYEKAKDVVCLIEDIEDQDEDIQKAKEKADGGYSLTIIIDDVELIFGEQDNVNYIYKKFFEAISQRKQNLHKKLKAI